MDLWLCPFRHRPFPPSHPLTPSPPHPLTHHPPPVTQHAPPTPLTFLCPAVHWQEVGRLRDEGSGAGDQGVPSPDDSL